MEIHQQISMPYHQTLKTMVKRSIDQKLRHGKIETGAVVKSPQGSSDVKRGKVYVTSGKKKRLVRRETSAVAGMRVDDCAPKPTPKAAPLSEPSMTRGRSASRKRSVRGRNPTARILRQPRRYFLKGTCTRSHFECWHFPECCQFYETELGCKTGDKCLFLEG